MNNHGKKCPQFGSSFRLILCILLRVLQIQKPFLEIISYDTSNFLKISSSMTGLDQLLALNNNILIQIALLVNCTNDDEICLLSVNILTLLSQYPVFNTMEISTGSFRKTNRLVSLLSSCNESSEIVAGFVHRLGLDEPENIMDLSNQIGTQSSLAALKIDSWRDPDLASFLFESSSLLSPVSSTPGVANLIRYAILFFFTFIVFVTKNLKSGMNYRLAILDLLILNLSSSLPFPTISHFLLGYDIKKSSGEPEIETTDLESPNAKLACLHVIISLLRSHTSISNRQISADNSEFISGVDYEAYAPLYETHPKLSEKCYQLIYSICSDPVTSSTTMRYLRTTEDFFYRQLEAMPIDRRVDSPSPSLNGSSLPSRLHQNAWFLKLIALELHVTTLAGQRSHAQRLLDLLFINPIPDHKKFNALKRPMLILSFLKMWI